MMVKLLIGRRSGHRLFVPVSEMYNKIQIDKAEQMQVGYYRFMKSIASN
jgi:hypothetical protein